jgi:intein/homing endonuclease
MNASAVGKASVEVKRAYLAGLIDGDGCIMATIERHREMKFGFRVRVELKITQKEDHLLRSLVKEWRIGHVSSNRKDSLYTTYDWIIREKNDLKQILQFIQPYTRLKKKQVAIALKILQTSIKTKQDLIKNAQLADSLSSFNVRSKDRRRNFTVMIQTHASSND